jgi:hypothetical protein
MQITKLNHLAKVKITKENCDEIIAESMELMKQASKIKLLKMQTEQRSERIKRGLAFKRQQQINNVQVHHNA